MRSKIQTIDQGGASERQSFIEIARRKQIIECAIDAIAELGFAQASLAQIAKRAGVSTAAAVPLGEPITVENYGRAADALRRDLRVAQVTCLKRGT